MKKTLSSFQKHFYINQHHYFFSLFGIFAVVKMCMLFMGFFGILMTKNTLAANPDDGFIISEYIEGSSSNKAIELYNGTSGDINLGNYNLVLYANGSATPTTTFNLPVVTLTAGDTYVITNSAASDPELIAASDITHAVVSFNGDDALLLYNDTDSRNVDVFGQIGFDPGTAWISGAVTTVDRTLVRKYVVMVGDPNGSDAFDPAAQRDVYPLDDGSYLGTHDMNAQPIGTITYDIFSATTGSVFAEIQFNESNVTIINNGGLSGYTFTDNGVFTFEFVDEFGSTGSATAEVYWIDQDTTPGATILTPGDIVIITTNVDYPDAFEFVSRVDLATGTKIYFSDKAWSGENNRNISEGTVRFIASGYIAAGTPMYFEEWYTITPPYSTTRTLLDWPETPWQGNFSLNKDGDNIFIYQGSLYTDSIPSFIYGFGFGGTWEWITTGNPDSESSYIPSTLNLNTTVNRGKNYDNVQYNCVNTGMRSSGFLADIANSGNWVGDNVARYTPISSCVFDATKPQIVIDTPTSQPNPSSGAAVVFLVTMSEPINVLSFEYTDMVLTGTAEGIALNDMTEIFPNDGTTFEIDVSANTDGTIIMQIYSGQIFDFAGNPNDDSNSKTITIDITPPTLTGATSVSNTTSNIPNYSFTGNEAGAITYTGGCSSSTISAISGLNTITFTPLTNGTYSGCQLMVTDALGNVSSRLSIPTFIVNYTTPSGGGGGGGGAYLPKDTCPNGDNSPSYYDLSCDAEAPTVLPTHGAATANTTRSLTRRVLANLSMIFAEEILELEADTSLGCSFSDTAKENTTTKLILAKICQLGIMGVEQNGIKALKNFRPNDKVTREEFITVVSRLLYDGKNNISLMSFTPRYNKHVIALKDIQLLTKIPTRITEFTAIEIFNYIKEHTEIIDRQ